MSEPIRCVVYTRVSTESQTENTSLAAQFVACQKKAESIGAIVIAHYEETKSGGLYLAREKLQQALKDIEVGRANALIIYRLDRTGRELDALRDIRRRIEKAGGQLIYADGMTFEKSAVGNLMFSQLGAFAEYEREVIRERTSLGSRKRAESGIMPVRARRPYGYKFDKDNKYVIVEDEAKWVRRIFEEYAAGNSLNAVGRMLHENHVPTFRGGAYWWPATIRLILTASVYIGKAAYGKQACLMDESRIERGTRPRYRVARPTSEWIYIDAPAIVPSRLWEQCQKRLTQAQWQFSGSKTSRRLLSGLLLCTSCHQTMKAFTVWRKTKHGRKPFNYYGCRNTASAPKPCANRRLLQAESLNDLVISAVAHVVSQPRILQLALQEYRRKQRKGIPPDESKRLKTEREKIVRRVEATAAAEIDARADGRDTTVYTNLLTRLETQLESIDKQLGKYAVARTQATQLKQAAISAGAMFTDVYDALKAPDDVIPAHEKNQALSRLIRYIEPRGEKELTGVDVHFNEHIAGLCYLAKVRGKRVYITIEQPAAPPKILRPVEVNDKGTL